MPENVSPEEKLLNLIKGKTNPEGEEKREVPSQPKQSPAEEKEIKPKQPVPTIVRKGKKELGNPFSILNKFLFLGILGVLIYMVLGYFFPYKSKTEIPEISEVSKALVSVEEDIGVLPPLSHYTGVVGRRKMFEIYEPPRPEPVGPQKPKVTLQQLLSGYTFVGIIFGEPPQAIIEENRTKQSYYLTAGQYLGEIKIEKIEKGKVTVSYGDETMDLRI